MTEEDILKRKQEQEEVVQEIPPAVLPEADGQAGAMVYPGDAAPAEAAPAEAQKPAHTHEEEDNRAFWREYGRELVRGSVKKIDGLGRLILVVDGLLVGLYANAIAFGDLRGEPLTGLQIFLYLLPVIFLLFSLLFAGGIFFLEKVPLELRTSRGARALYHEAVRNKLVFLRTSMLLLALAVVAVIGALWVFMSGG